MPVNIRISGNPRHDNVYIFKPELGHLAREAAELRHWAIHAYSWECAEGTKSDTCAVCTHGINHGPQRG